MCGDSEDCMALSTWKAGKSGVCQSLKLFNSKVFDVYM